MLLRDDYCDGLGSCLPVCPTGAISFEEREALPFDEAAVLARGDDHSDAADPAASDGGCPGSQARTLETSAPPSLCGCPGSQAKTLTPMGAPLGGIASRMSGAGPTAQVSAQNGRVSALRQWPVQIQLVPVNAPYFSGADLLIAADCSAYAYAGFHEEFMDGKVTLIGCPKLDDCDYADKLSAILRTNAVNSVTVVRMSVPCCGGLEQAVARAVWDSGKKLPVRVVTLSPEGRVLSA